MRTNNKDRQMRNTYLDIVKYFTIFCVIWGHVVQQTCLLKNPSIDYIYRFIYTFHMPLFMGICGYFFAKSINKSGRQKYIQKKLKTRLLGLIIPMLSFGALKIIIVGKFGVLSYLRLVHDVWFLGDVAINTLLVIFVLKWCDNKFWHDIKFFMIIFPLACIPKLGYGSHGGFMYLFFVGGYCLAKYYKKDFQEYCNYGKYFLGVFVVSFLLFDYIFYDPSGFMLSIKEPIGMIAAGTLKIILGVTGCYLMLLAIYKIVPFFSNSKLEYRAIEQGRFTLDIYLLNIIILEMIGGPLYRKLVKLYDFNFFYEYGLIFEVISTFIGACIMMEIIIFVGKMMNKNRYIAKVFFYRDINQ